MNKKVTATESRKKGLEIRPAVVFKEDEQWVCGRKVVFRKFVKVQQIVVNGNILATYPFSWPGGGEDEVDRTK